VNAPFGFVNECRPPSAPLLTIDIVVTIDVVSLGNYSVFVYKKKVPQQPLGKPSCIAQAESLSQCRHFVACATHAVSALILFDKTGLSGYYVFCSGNYRYFGNLGIKQKSILSKIISGLCVFHKSRGEYNGRSGRSN